MNLVFSKGSATRSYTITYRHSYRWQKITLCSYYNELTSAKCPTFSIISYSVAKNINNFTCNEFVANLQWGLKEQS